MSSAGKEIILSENMISHLKSLEKRTSELSLRLKHKEIECSLLKNAFQDLENEFQNVSINVNIKNFIKLTVVEIGTDNSNFPAKEIKLEDQNLGKNVLKPAENERESELTNNNWVSGISYKYFHHTFEYLTVEELMILRLTNKMFSNKIIQFFGKKCEEIRILYANERKIYDDIWLMYKEKFQKICLSIKQSMILFHEFMAMHRPPGFLQATCSAFLAILNFENYIEWRDFVRYSNSDFREFLRKISSFTPLKLKIKRIRIAKKYIENLTYEMVQSRSSVASLLYNCIEVFLIINNELRTKGIESIEQLARPLSIWSKLEKFFLK